MITLHFHKHSCVTFSLHEAWYVHYKSISYIYYHILPVHVQEWVIVCMQRFRWTPSMKRLFSGRSMIIPLPLRSYHPKSVPEDLTVSFSVFDHREQISVTKTAIKQSSHYSHTIFLIPYSWNSFFPQFWPQRNEVNFPSI